MPDPRDNEVPLLPILMRQLPSSPNVAATAPIDRAATLGPILFRLVEGEASFALDRMVARAYHDSAAAHELSQALGCNASLLNPDLAQQAGAPPIGLDTALKNARHASRVAVDSKMAVAAAELLGPDLFAVGARWAAGYFEADFALYTQDEAAKRHLDQALGLARPQIHGRPPAEVAWLANTSPPTPRDRLLLALYRETLQMLSLGVFVATGVPDFEERPVPIKSGLWRGGKFRAAPREGAILFGDQTARKKLFDVRFSRRRQEGSPAVDTEVTQPLPVSAPRARIIVKHGEMERVALRLLVENRDMALQTGPMPFAAWIAKQLERANKPGQLYTTDAVFKKIAPEWDDLVAGRPIII